MQINVATLTELDKNRINRYFHIMDSVSVPKGCIITDTGEAVYTVYTSCMDISKCNFYYTTYENRDVKKIGMYDFDLNENKIVKIEM